MRIYSYNINGVRAALKKGLIEWLEKEAPDVICFQEIKAQEDQIPVEEFEKIGYHHYWYPAEKKGYSGVALLSKQKPDRVKLGCGIAEYDREGRILQADFGDITLLSCYFPSGSSGDERQAFKMKFLSDFEEYASQLSKERPKLIISGDVNICHEEIDIHNPKGLKSVNG
jgi:exodeoxyribonuclease-3